MSQTPPSSSDSTAAAKPPMRHLRPDCGGFDGWLLLMLWRCLNLWTILLAMILAYGGYWWLTERRLTNPGIGGRMEFAAEFVSLRESDTTVAAQKVTKALDKLKGEFDHFAFHPADFRPPPSMLPTTKPFEQQFVDAAATLAVARDGSHELQTALDNFNAYAATWYDRRDPDEPNFPRWPDFRHDDQLRKGADVSAPQGSIEALRDDAEQFLRDEHMFDGWKQFWAASDQSKLRP